MARSAPDVPRAMNEVQADVGAVRRQRIHRTTAIGQVDVVDQDGGERTLGALGHRRPATMKLANLAAAAPSIMIDLRFRGSAHEPLTEIMLNGTPWSSATRAIRP
jgi:hypothetical protein